MLYAFVRIIPIHPAVENCPQSTTHRRKTRVRWSEVPVRNMAKIDGRIHISSCVDSTTGLITFEEQCVTGEEGLLCAVCLETIGFGAKAAAVVDTQRHCALCQLAADPENGEALRSHIMHTWCAEGVGLEACPACSSPSSGKGKKPAPIARIGFDIGGVIVRHRDMFAVGKPFIHFCLWSTT